MNDEDRGPPRVKRKYLDDDFDGDDDDIPMTPPHSQNGISDGRIHERMFMLGTTNNLIISQMEDEIRKMRDEKAEQSGHIQYLKFKVQNSDKEKAQLQSQLIEMRKLYEQRLSDERSRHERLEEELRCEITYQEQEQRSKQFRERFSSAVTIPVEEQSQVTFAVPDEASQASASLLQTKKVMLNSRRSGVAFPRSLNDSRNLASLFSHRKRTNGETQTTFQSVPSPPKDPYHRPDFFYDIKRRPSAENSTLNGGERRYRLGSAMTNSVETQTSTRNIFDVSDCVSNKHTIDAIWALYDNSADVDFWNIKPLRIFKGDSSARHVRLRDCSFC